MGLGSFLVSGQDWHTLNDWVATTCMGYVIRALEAKTRLPDLEFKMRLVDYRTQKYFDMRFGKLVS